VYKTSLNWYDISKINMRACIIVSKCKETMFMQFKTLYILTSQYESVISWCLPTILDHTSYYTLVHVRWLSSALWSHATNDSTVYITTDVSFALTTSHMHHLIRSSWLQHQQQQQHAVEAAMASVAARHCVEISERLAGWTNAFCRWGMMRSVAQ